MCATQKLNGFMSESQKSGVSFFNANITLIISVSLVLLLFGIVGVMGIAGVNLTRYVKENIGFDIVLKESADEHQVNALKQYLNKAPFVSSVRYVSKEDALAEWEKETGENLIATLGVNPLSAEFEVNVKSEYASVDSLNAICAAIAQGPAVDEINIQRDLIEKVNENMRHAAIVLGAVALILLIISVALINNTVRLSVYSKRFLIHTMKLVGATSGFIRRPFIRANIINGIIAGILANLLLAVALYYTLQLSDELAWVVSPEEVGCVMGAVVLCGILLCWIATLFAANKYLRLDYDALFKR